jgi:hypothetical protein
MRRWTRPSKNEYVVDARRVTSLFGPVTGIALSDANTERGPVLAVVESSFVTAQESGNATAPEHVGTLTEWDTPLHGRGVGATETPRGTSLYAYLSERPERSERPRLWRSCSNTASLHNNTWAVHCDLMRRFITSTATRPTTVGRTFRYASGSMEPVWFPPAVTVGRGTSSTFLSDTVS